MHCLRVLSALLGLVICAPALDREAFTFTRYDLNATVEPAQQRLGVRGKITLRNDSGAPQRSFVLQISSSLHWLSIQSGGKSVQFVTQNYNSDIDHTGALSEVIVTSAKPVLPRESVELEIGYEGTIPQDGTRLTQIGVPGETARHSDWDQISTSFTAVRGIGYVTWYPIATEAAGLADPSSVSEAVGRWKKRENGSEMKVEFIHSNDSGMRTSLYCNGLGRQVALDQISRAYSAVSRCEFNSLGNTAPLFLIGLYRAIDRPVVNISYMPDDKSGANDFALAVDQVMPALTRWFGDHRETPELKAEVVELPDPKDSPYQSGNMLLTPLSADETTMLLSSVQLLTHVIFPSPRTWISDGLAAYAQARYIEQEKNRSAALGYLENHREALVDAESEAVKQGAGRTSEHSLTDAVDGFYVQSKAMYVWWMLRDLVGETALTAALHSYKAADDKDAAYVQKLIETQAHRNLNWFFDDWVYRDRGLPDLRIASVYSHAAQGGGYMVTVTAENVGDAAAEVPVTVHMLTGEASERLLVRGKSNATIRIMAGNLPMKVVVNDGSVPESDVTNNSYKIEQLNH